MGVVVLPDGEPNPGEYQTVGAYAKAYVDWKVAREIAELQARIVELERAAEVKGP